MKLHLTSIDAIVPVPYEVRRRAWECAEDLARAAPGHVPPLDQLHAQNLSRLPIASLSWLACKQMIRLHRQVWPRGVR